MAAGGDRDRVDFVWLELTGQCQLQCTHCYASSGPFGNHGTMSAADWRRVLDQAAALGVRDVQFIGGEPTLHPDLPDLLRYALGRGLSVEVYSNLMRVTEALWEVLSLPGVRLATSYYSSVPAHHDSITGRPSHGRTLANIREAVRRGIPIRVGVVDVEEGQGAGAAVRELRALGVESVSVDRLRQVGRGVRGQSAGVDQLCGRCSDGTLAVSPNGDVWPCVLARWLVVGNVHQADLAAINTAASGVRGDLMEAFSVRAASEDCDPKCEPRKYGPECPPNFEKPDCNPKGGGDGCDPRNKPAN